MDIQMMRAHMMIPAAAGWTSRANWVFPVEIRAKTTTMENVKRKREMTILAQSSGEFVP
jgi:hypothetical protein